ncbi:MAG: cobalamin-binding protein [Myxococcales bacterium]|nr:cobalamin-binding protein [Myxococcales bacterium]MCB9580333.1 cobalamin-binding protein [Polyangiaceae bacterium]
MRVVSLACSNTEIVCALGRADWLVGVDDHSDHPTDVVSRLPRVGPDLGIDIERVRALRPDLVLASLTVPGHERIVEALERAKLPYLAPEPVSVADVYRDIQDIAGRLDVEARGRELVAAMRRELDATPEPARPVRVLVEWWPKPVIVPGRDSWVTQLLSAAGGENPFGDRTVKSTPIDDREAVAADPDAIVISWCGVRPEKYRPDVVLRRPAWQGLRAVREGRVHCIPEAYLGRPGPRLVDGVRALRALVHESSRASASSI